MTKEIFKASAQYNDWQGTAAADDADQDDFSDYLRLIGKMDGQDRLLGISFYSAPNFTHVNAFISDDNDKIRRIAVPMSVDDFFKKFKRFSIFISRHGDLDGKNIDLTDETEE